MVLQVASAAERDAPAVMGGPSLEEAGGRARALFVAGGLVELVLAYLAGEIDEPRERFAGLAADLVLGANA